MRLHARRRASRRGNALAAGFKHKGAQVSVHRGHVTAIHGHDDPADIVRFIGS